MAARPRADKGAGPRHHDAGGGDDRPESAQEAVALALSHARVATREALAAMQALLDAASLAATGADSEANRLLAPIAKLLEQLTGDLDASGRDATSVLDAVSEALDAEIARWQTRARDDVEARSVLRAFLGLREVLWEFGVGRDSTSTSPKRKAGRRRRPPRVQRIPVDG